MMELIVAHEDSKFLLGDVPSSILAMDTILSKKRHILECIATHKDSNILLGDVPLSIPVLDTNLYNLTPEEAAFFKTQIGIDDDEELKKHILEVQTKAYEASHSERTSLQVI